MRGFADGRPGPKRALRLGIAVLALAGALPVEGASAQYYDGPRGGYGGPPPGYDEDDRGSRPPPRRAARESIGFNCSAVQQSITGPKPYSCPLPGPRPLGVRCFCDLPIAPFNPPQTAVGQVVP